MSRKLPMLFLALLLAMASGSTVTFAAPGDPAGEQAAPPPRHGGVMSVTKGHAFESVAAPHGIRVYLYTDEHGPAMVENAAGQATLSLPGDTTVTVKLVPETPGDKEPATYFCPMHVEVVRDKPGECELCGGMKLFKQDRLYGQVDLSKVKLDELKATIQVKGMRGAEKEATFTPAFRAPDRKAKETQSGDSVPGSGELKGASMAGISSGCAMGRTAGTGSCCSGKAKASGTMAGCEMRPHAAAASPGKDTSPRGH